MDEDAMDQDSRGRMIILAGSICCAIGTTAVTLRLFTRIHINRQVGPDDWLAVISLLCMFGMAISQMVNAMKCLGQHEWQFDAHLDIPGFFENFWITTIFYNAALLFIKLTFLFQYFRVFRQVQSMRTTYIVAMVAVTAWNFGELLSVIFLCLPVAGFWDKSIDATCQNQQIGVYVNAAGNMITDLIIIVLPLPALWKLHLPRGQKVAVFGIFGIGSITLVISIIRLTTIHTGSIDDFTYDTWTSACFSIAELASGITCAALATLRPLIGQIFPFLFTHAHETTVKYHGDDKHPPTIGSGRSNSKVRRRLSADSKAWDVDMSDIDSESAAGSLPGTPKVTTTSTTTTTTAAIRNGRDQALSLHAHIKAFQMLGPRLGSETQVMSPKVNGRPTFLEMETRPNTPVSAIMVERKFEVTLDDAHGGVETTSRY